ncbi:MAG: 3'(2'),5'-bisphosphate nucleotidase CysQ [Bacteroidia bacterium]
MIDQKMIDIVVDACYSAGEAIMNIYNTADFGVEMKSNNSPLTLADQAGHEAIVKYLVSTPYPILSEEGRGIPYEERANWDFFWMVDPLDGTKEFIKRNGEFTVNIALIHKQKPVFGAVYVPVKDELYIGGSNRVATCTSNGKTVELNRSRKEEFHALTAHSGLKIVASRSHLNDETQEFLDSLDQPEIVSMGSSLKFMALANKEADIYPRFAPTMEWDTAAAHGVIASLGYRVEKQDGTELEYNKEDLLNPYFICY